MSPEPKDVRVELHFATPNDLQKILPCVRTVGRRESVEVKEKSVTFIVFSKRLRILAGCMRLYGVSCKVTRFVINGIPHNTSLNPMQV